jgi:hypothetical protein
VAVSIDIQNTGDPAGHAELTGMIQHILSDRVGDWQVSIVGSQANKQWEMKIHGPNAFERSYMLDGAAGEHRPEVIRKLLQRMLPAKSDY